MVVEVKSPPRNRLLYCTQEIGKLYSREMKYWDGEMCSCWTWVNSSSQKCDLVVRHHSGLDSPFKNSMKSLVSFPDHSPLPQRGE